MRTLILIRGLPGSGKTTMAHKIADSVSSVRTEAVSADDFMCDFSGNYKFHPERLPSCHEACRRIVRKSMETEAPIIIVHNTFIREKEIAPYRALARDYGYELEITVPPGGFDGGCANEELAQRNQHGVPLATIKRMRNSYENVDDKV